MESIIAAFNHHTFRVIEVNWNLSQESMVRGMHGLENSCHHMNCLEGLRGRPSTKQRHSYKNEEVGQGLTKKVKAKTQFQGRW